MYPPRIPPIAPERFSDALALERAGSDRRADLDESWVYDGRIFGGYLAALAGMAAAGDAEDALLRSAQVVFADAARAGAVVFAVEPLRQGRTATPVRVVGRQSGGVVVSAHFWLVSPGIQGDAASAEHEAGAGAPAPERCEPVPWVTEFAPFLRHLEERAVDYPLSLEGFHDGKPHVDVWARLTPPEPDAPPLVSQLFDLMLFDAHLLDGVARRHGIAISAASLDLSANWMRPGGVREWTRVAARAVLTGSLAAASATLHSESGARRATATSQALVSGA